MPGDPKECRERAARCLELAASTANESVKQTLLGIARHWQVLAEELERFKTVLDDEKGAVKLARKRRHGGRRRVARGRKRKKRSLRARTKRPNDSTAWIVWARHRVGGRKQRRDTGLRQN